MKKILVISLLVFMSSAGAGTTGLGPREEHGDPADEQRCFAEIRSLGCGNPENYAAFIECVDSRLYELSEDCQVFHIDEKGRAKRRLDS